jgi:hypothetical protein
VISGWLRLLESPKEQFDQPAGVVAGVAVGSDTEVADAAHQFIGLRAWRDFVGVDCGVKQLLLVAKRVAAIAELSAAYLRTRFHRDDNAWQAAQDALTTGPDALGRVETR